MDRASGVSHSQNSLRNCRPRSPRPEGQFFGGSQKRGYPDKPVGGCTLTDPGNWDRHLSGEGAPARLLAGAHLGGHWHQWRLGTRKTERAPSSSAAARASGIQTSLPSRKAPLPPCQHLGLSEHHLGVSTPEFHWEPWLGILCSLLECLRSW